MRHEVGYCACGCALLAVQVGLLADDHGGGALYSHAGVQRAALFAKR